MSKLLERVRGRVKKSKRSAWYWEGLSETVVVEYADNEMKRLRDFLSSRTGCEDSTAHGLRVVPMCNVRVPTFDMEDAFSSHRPIAKPSPSPNHFHNSLVLPVCCNVLSNAFYRGLLCCRRLLLWRQEWHQVNHRVHAYPIFSSFSSPSLHYHCPFVADLIQML